MSCPFSCRRALVRMAVDGQHTVCVFHHDIATLIETEHTRHIAVAFAAIPYLRFVYLFREVIPYDGGQFYPNTDIHLVVRHLNAVFFGTTARTCGLPTRPTANSILSAANDPSGVLMICFSRSTSSTSVCVNISTWPLNIIDHTLHRIEVCVCAEVFERRLLHVQVVFETQCLEIIVRHITLFRRAELPEQRIRLFDIRHHCMFIEKIGYNQPPYSVDMMYLPSLKAPAPAMPSMIAQCLHPTHVLA